MYKFSDSEGEKVDHILIAVYVIYHIMRLIKLKGLKWNLTGDCGLRSNLNEVRLGFKPFSLVNYNTDQTQRHEFIIYPSQTTIMDTHHTGMTVHR